MSQTIEIEVGDLYAQIHERYTEGAGEQYTERLRQNTEDFLHQFNQQVERQRDAVGEGEAEEMEVEAEE